MILWFIVITGFVIPVLVVILEWLGFFAFIGRQFNRLMDRILTDKVVLAYIRFKEKLEENPFYQVWQLLRNQKTRD